MWAIYKAELAKGKTEAQAIEEAEIFTMRTQQSASASKMSLAQKGTGMQKSLTMFKNAILQQIRIPYIATQDFLRGQITLPELARTYTLFLVIMPFLISAISRSFRPDKEWKGTFNDILSQNMSGIPIMGDLIQTFSSTIFGQKYFARDLYPFADEFSDFATNMAKLVKGDVDKIKWDKFLTGLIEALSVPTGVGIPAKRLWNASEGIYNITAEGKTTKGLLKLGGYTDYTATKVTE
jgi:hypothetical protein